MVHTRRTVLTTAVTFGTITLAGCVSGIITDSDDEDGQPGDGVDDDAADLNDGDDADDADEVDGGDDGDSDDAAGLDDDPVEDDGDDSDADDQTAADDPPSDELDHLPGEAIDDFADLDQWFAFVGQGSIEATEDDPYANDQSALITADEDVDYAGVYREFMEPLDLSEQTLSLAVRFTGRELFDLTVQVLAPNSRNYLNHRRVFTGPADRWVRVDLGANYEETQPDLHDVREIRVIGRRRGEAGPISFALDDLRVVDRPETGAVLFLFDATLADHYEVAFPIMEEFGFDGVETVTPETVDRDGRLTLDQMREMDDAGWEMIARPRVGGQFMHEYDRDEQEGMIRRTQTYLLNRGFESGAQHMFVPRNVIGPDGMDLVREYHESAFRYGGGPNGLPATDPHNLGYFNTDDDDTTRSFVDLAARHKQLAVPRFESFGEDGMDEDAFRDLLEYIDEADVDVVTATGAHDR